MDYLNRSDIYIYNAADTDISVLIKKDAQANDGREWRAQRKF